MYEYKARKAAIEKIQKILKDMLSIADNYAYQIHNLYDSYAEYRDLNGEEERFVKALNNASVTAYTSEIINYQALYSALIGLFATNNGQSHNIKRIINDEITEKYGFVQVKVVHDKVVLRLPRIPLKAFRRLYVFQDIINDKVTELLKNKELPQMQSMTVTIYHVFNSDFPVKHIPDNDNYDFKRYVDIMVDCIAGSDSGLTCKFVMDSVVTDSIPEGDYLIFSPGKQGLDDNEITKLLSNIF